MKKILFSGLMALTMLSVASCSDDEPKLSEHTALYQELQADFSPSGQNAFANFRQETSQGKFVCLNNGSSVTANSMPMTYMNHELFNKENEGMQFMFDYTLNIDGVQPAVRFELKRGNTSIVNIARRTDVSNIRIPAISSIKLGQPIKLDVQPQTGEVFTAQLVKSGSDKIYTAIYNSMDATATFVDVPAGVYTLQFMTKTVKPLQQTDNGADGKITVYFTDQRTLNVTANE